MGEPRPGRRAPGQVLDHDALQAALGLRTAGPRRRADVAAQMISVVFAHHLHDLDWLGVAVGRGAESSS
jgi:hypothetical protein